MEVGYKNLILIDNSKSVGEANFMLCKETAKYICDNANEKDMYRIAVFGEDVEYLSDYTSDNVMASGLIDNIILEDRDTYITDNLVGILKEWREKDVACRNIILFTDGDEAESLLHADEELYYLLSDSEYPVYVVQCVDNINVQPKRNLSAIATISGGELQLTEFEGSDAASEKTMGGKILAAMDSKRTDTEEEESGQEVPEETADTHEAEDAEEGSAAGTDESLMIYSDSDAEGYYRETVAIDSASSGNDALKPIIRNSADQHHTPGPGILLPVMGLFLALGFALLIRMMTVSLRGVKARRRGMDDDEFEREARVAFCAEDYDCMTMRLSEENTATRLLDPTGSGMDIVLEDCNDPTRLFRASTDASLIVGRSAGLCDVAIPDDDSVSGRHCELAVRDGCLFVRDLNSSNGTRVNGQKVFQELMLKCGDILTLGQSSLMVRI
ncbi:MAG: FHA domain-containing protein [Lachnospiraceae bacterium]|nr:FHA domain-containing protein [Lachnospiraceae bacterium]